MEGSYGGFVLGRYPSRNGHALHPLFPGRLQPSDGHPVDSQCRLLCREGTGLSLLVLGVVLGAEGVPDDVRPGGRRARELLTGLPGFLLFFHRPGDVLFQAGQGSQLRPQQVFGISVPPAGHHQHGQGQQQRHAGRHAQSEGSLGGVDVAVPAVLARQQSDDAYGCIHHRDQDEVPQHPGDHRSGAESPDQPHLQGEQSQGGAESQRIIGVDIRTDRVGEGGGCRYPDGHRCQSPQRSLQVAAPLGLSFSVLVFAVSGDGGGDYRDHHQPGEAYPDEGALGAGHGHDSEGFRRPGAQDEADQGRKQQSDEDNRGPGQVGQAAAPQLGELVVEPAHRGAQGLSVGVDDLGERRSDPSEQGGGVLANPVRKGRGVFAFVVA